MKKIVNICLIFALLVSIFDIIDINDITLNGKEIFTTDNACARHDNDDLSDNAVHYTAISQLIFNLPQIIHYAAVAAKPETPLPHLGHPDYPTRSFNLCRPPIA